jgi:hypothetical protein
MTYQEARKTWENNYSLKWQMTQSRNYQDLNKEEIQLICDYLCIPSTSAEQDIIRRKKLYELNIVKRTKINQSNDKYLTGPLGEAIVSLYFDKIDRIFIAKPPQVKYLNDNNEHVIIRPDGLHIYPPVDFNIWVESKMRAYLSNGSANEKIHGVVEKYCHLNDKLMLFLLADDEHKYNKRWYKLRRGEASPNNKCEEYHMLGDLKVLHSIVLGTEVANILQK